MQKLKKKSVEESILKSRIEPIFVFVLFGIWVYFVLLKTNYFTYFPLAFSKTGLFEGRLFIDLAKIKLLLKSFFISFFTILSCYNYGLILIKNLFKRVINIKKELVLYPVLGAGFVAMIVYILGLCGLVYKLCYLIFIISGILLGFIFHQKEEWNISKKYLPNFNFLQLCLFLIFIYTSFINLLGALTPETFFDSQFYLLGNLNLWKLNHKISFNPYSFSSLYPFNINMLYLINIVLNNDISAKLISWFCGLVCCFVVYNFTKKYFSKTTALVAVLIFYTVPNVMMVSWKTAIELGITMFETAMVFCMIEFLFSKEKYWLILSGIFAGFALGSKYLVLLEFFSISVAFLIFRILNKEKFFEIFKDYVYFLFSAIIVCSFWYLRNIILTGNPVFPFFAHKIGFVKPRIVGNIFSDPPMPKFNFKNYFLFLWPLTLGQLQQESYPGGIFLVFLPLLFLFKNVDKKIKFLSVYVIICLVLWIIIGRFYLRYFIPVLVVISVIYAYFIIQNPLPNFFKNLFLILLIFITASNINFSMRVLHFTQTPAKFVFSDMTIKEYLSTQRPSYPCPYYQVADWVNKNLPLDSKILLLGETRGLFFERKYLTHGVLEYSPLVETLKKVNSAEELYKEFKKQKITHILLNVPEAKRLSGYDNFYFELKEFKIWVEFWNKYIKEIYRDIADISLPEHGIYSLKHQRSDWWQQYSSDLHNYVYLYEILDEKEAIQKKHTVPYNFFLEPQIYPQHRWEKIKIVMQEL